uniref:Lipocalin n=1 Tax=Rhipicephalus zambeziensis TaxID=60191 RepID=A0A224YC13_9ACAR
MAMTFKCCFAVISLTCFAMLFGKGAPSTDTTSIADNAKKMLESRTPLVLLWANDVPSSLGDKTCLLSQYDKYHPDGYAHHIYQGTPNTALAPPGRRSSSYKAWLLLSLWRVQNQVTLKVKIMSGSFYSIAESHRFPILFANGRCLILQVPEVFQSNVKCVAWVQANTAHHIHRDCKVAFATLCPACKGTEDQPPENES